MGAKAIALVAGCAYVAAVVNGDANECFGDLNICGDICGSQRLDDGSAVITYGSTAFGTQLSTETNATCFQECGKERGEANDECLATFAEIESELNTCKPLFETTCTRCESIEDNEEKRTCIREQKFCLRADAEVVAQCGTVTSVFVEFDAEQSEEDFFCYHDAIRPCIDPCPLAPEGKALTFFLQRSPFFEQASFDLDCANECIAANASLASDCVALSQALIADVQECERVQQAECPITCTDDACIKELLNCVRTNEKVLFACHETRVSKTFTFPGGGEDDEDDSGSSSLSTSVFLGSILTLLQLLALEH